MKILVKYPTRERPKQFLKALKRAISLQTTNNVQYLVSYDLDDHTMTEPIITGVQGDYSNVKMVGGNSTSKIHACNRDVATYNGEWDIVVLLSDDMICIKKGWDAQLIDEMTMKYPDTDGVLFHNDGYCEQRLNTMCILGKAYYNRFGYIYHPSYKSLFSDNEFQEVAEKLGKQTYYSEVLFRHEHPVNNGDMSLHDNLYRKNDVKFKADKNNYEKRKRTDFA